MLYVYNFNVTVKKYLHVLALDYIAVVVSGKVGPVKPVNHTSWVALVTPTDRPKSVSNRCLIELFCGVVCVVTLPFWHFCWCRGFCHRTESDLFPFLVIPFFPLLSRAFEYIYKTKVLCCEITWPKVHICRIHICKSKLWRFCVVTLLFWIFVRYGGFCHLTESDLFLFL